MNHPEVSKLLRSANPEDRVGAEFIYSHFDIALRLYMKPLLETADSPTSVDSSTVSAWLKELLLSDSKDYDSSLALFKEDPNTTTLAISDELARISEIIVAKQWREQLSDELAKSLRNDTVNSWRSEQLSRPLRFALHELRCDPRWLRACNKVNEFCLRAGSAGVTENVFENIEVLREIPIRSPGRETGLLAEIKILKERVDAKDDESKQQRRIIEDLSYRHLMENIIDPQKWTGNYASDWRTFWDDAVNSASSARNRAPRKPSSPIVELINQFGPGNIAMIKGTGGAMYGAISTNIHHYGDTVNGVYQLQCQRDKLPEEIMKALTPLTINIQNNKVDWLAERTRFI